MALAMIVIHLLGDVMSPVLAGALWQVLSLFSSLLLSSLELNDT